MAAESSPLSPELRNRNKRKETTHYQRASLGRYTTYTQSSNHLTFINNKLSWVASSFACLQILVWQKMWVLISKLWAPFFFSTQLSMVSSLSVFSSHSWRAVCNLVAGHSTVVGPQLGLSFKIQHCKKTTRFRELAITLVMDHRLFLGKSPHCATGHLIYLVAPIP